ncbi:LD-carboxypeptidase [Pseudomonas asuensis]|uniref:Murein tetrapeptide carboxypeptidase n=1 Tax=Pseudomonas asuensis TaxID=1825787 RepID=A0ABQ2GRU9_9PSED|nr:LD-carboxypeptidase [Pseudomonas asuensis]GGM07914.1 murein tetrapeptide carboxypeptidase [Pseudomonas asuensis]
MAGSTSLLDASSFAGKVALIAPAAAIANEALEVTYAQLAEMGVSYIAGEHARARHRYLAGTLDQRLADLYAAFEHPEVSAVWCLRGGYGCAQLLPHIDWARIRRAGPKPLIGFSDISIMLSAFHRHGLPGVHGPVATALAKTYGGEEQEHHEDSFRSLDRLLKSTKGYLPAKPVSRVGKTIQGPLIGGNLTALASAEGTGYGLYAPAGAILVLEDVGEPYYRIERSLWQLLNSIDSAQLGAVCLGTFTDCPRKGVAHSIEEIVAEWLAPHGVPLFSGLPSGHGPDNQAWPYGREARLDHDGLHW